MLIAENMKPYVSWLILCKVFERYEYDSCSCFSETFLGISRRTCISRYVKILLQQEFPISHNGIENFSFIRYAFISKSPLELVLIFTAHKSAFSYDALLIQDGSLGSGFETVSTSSWAKILAKESRAISELAGISFSK